MKNYIKSALVSFRYSRKLAKIKNGRKNRKVKILFYVTENSKWGYQSLYEILAKDERFEVLVVVGVLNGVHKGKDRTRQNLEENYNFFKSRGMNVEYGYRNNKFVSLKSFAPDVVFYEQPWELPRSHRPLNVSKFAVTCHCPYSFQLFKNMQDLYDKFYGLLYRYYLTHELNLKRIEKHIKTKAKNCDVVGYPKLDVYNKNKNIKNCWKHKDRIKIIYAPHHALEKGSLRLSTFEENGKLILDWAKKHPEITWIFKPHPRLRYALAHTGIMNEEEIESYYKEWEKLGVVYTQGDYFDIFKSSDLMITDCGSFLAEYLPTKKPLIRPINDDAIELNEIGSLVASEYYQTRNNQELLSVLEEVVVNKNDYKKDARLKIIDEFFDYEESSAFKIYKGLLRDFGMEKNND